MDALGWVQLSLVHSFDAATISRIGRNRINLFIISDGGALVVSRVIRYLLSLLWDEADKSLRALVRWCAGAGAAYVMYYAGFGTDPLSDLLSTFNAPLVVISDRVLPSVSTPSERNAQHAVQERNQFIDRQPPPRVEHNKIETGAVPPRSIRPNSQNPSSISEPSLLHRLDSWILDFLGLEPKRSGNAGR